MNCGAPQEARLFQGRGPQLTNLLKLALLLLALILPTGTIYSQETERYTKVAKQLVEAINAADYQRIQAMYDPGMDAALPLAKSSDFFKGLTRSYGKLKSLGPARPTAQGTVFLARFERGTLDMTIVLDSQDKISGLLFKPPASAKPALK